MKDIYDPAVEQEYDEKVLKQARELNKECGQDTVLMEQKLKALGVDEAGIIQVFNAQVDPDWDDTDDYLGDETVYETIKDVLRPLYGF
jgi:hypothetical protein